MIDQAFIQTHRKTCHGHCPACLLLDKVDELHKALVESERSYVNLYEEGVSRVQEREAEWQGMEMERLRAALTKYGQHEEHCEKWTTEQIMDGGWSRPFIEYKRPCTCGYENSLKVEE